MKLLHISPSYYPAFRFGGPIQSVHLLNKALVKKGIKVDVITTNAGLSQDQRKKIKDKSIGNELSQEQRKKIKDKSKGILRSPDPSSLALRQAQCDTSSDDTELRVTLGQAAQGDKEEWNDVDGVRVKYLGFMGYEHYNFSMQIVKEIWKIIDDYDLVHITAVWNFPVLAGALISLIKRKPYIISPRGVLLQKALTVKSGLIKKFYFNLFAKHYLKKAAAIHYTTQIEKEESERILNHKNSFVVPNGIDLCAIVQSGKRIEPFINQKYVLTLGRIDRIKGFDILIPAFAEICKNNNDINLVIAGEDSAAYASEVRKMVEAKKISDKVIFTGQVTGDDKWDLYKNAFMFVLPSYSENFGMSVVEAMASGCPIVISDKVGIYKEVEENTAGIIVETNSKSVEEGIIKLLRNEKLRQQITMNGKAMVDKYYDIDKVAEQMIEQY